MKSRRNNAVLREPAEVLASAPGAPERLSNFQQVLMSMHSNEHSVAIELTLPTEDWLKMMDIAKGDMSKIPGIVREIIVMGRDLYGLWFEDCPQWIRNRMAGKGGAL